MNNLDAFEKWVTENPEYHNLSRMEKIAFVLGFMDGFKMAQEDAQKKLDAYAAFVAGKITRAELEEALK